MQANHMDTVFLIAGGHRDTLLQLTEEGRRVPGGKSGFIEGKLTVIPYF